MCPATCRGDSGRAVTARQHRRGHRSATPPGSAVGRVPRIMRRFLIPLLAALLAAAATAGVAVAARRRPGSWRARVLRDRALGRPALQRRQKTVGVPNLIADMNTPALAFTAHDGDLKAGSGPCPDSLYTDAKATLQHARRAGRSSRRATTTGPTATATPGSTRAERLDFERKVLFSTPFTLGQHQLRQEVQARRRLRREPPLERRRRHLRHAQRPGLVQQPLRHRARPGRVRGPQRRRHRLAAADLRRGARRDARRP